jgi:hypothetical protein
MVRAEPLLPLPKTDHEPAASAYLEQILTVNNYLCNENASCIWPAEKLSKLSNLLVLFQHFNPAILGLLAFRLLFSNMI